MVANADDLRTGRPSPRRRRHRARGRSKASARRLPEGFHVDPNAPLLVRVRPAARPRDSAARVSAARASAGDASCDTGVGVLAQGAGPRTMVTIAGNVVFEYQRSGIVANEPGLRAVSPGTR